MTKKNRLLLGSASLVSVLAIVPAAVISCGAYSTNDNNTSDQTSINNYIASIETLTGSNAISGKSTQVLPTTITNTDYVTYLNNIPVPATNSGIVLSFALTNLSPKTGTADMTITATIGQLQETSSSIAVSGFLTTQSAQTIVNNYITSTENLTGNSAISGISTQSIPAVITSSNYATYLNNVLTPSGGIVLSFALTNQNTATGTADMIITATIGSIVATSRLIAVSGFFTQQSLVDSYITSIENLTSNNAIIGNSTQLVPATITSTNYTTYLSSFPTPANSQISLTFATVTTNPVSGTLIMTVTATIGSASKKSSLISVSGFLPASQYLQNSINAINLQANSIMPAPTATTSPLLLINAQPILTTFNISSSQNLSLNQIQNLSMSVTNSSITAGTATVEFSINDNGIVITYAQNYSGFFAGTSAEIQTHLSTYLSNPTNASTFLQNYLNTNQSFLTSLIINPSNGNSYWSYSVNSSNGNGNNFNNIAVVYNITTQTYNITAATTNVINISIYNNATNEFDSGGVIPVGTRVTINLPFLFSGTKPNYSPITIAVSSTGSVVLSWTTPQFTGYQDTIGLHTNYVFNNSTTNGVLPWRTPTIPIIIF